MKKVLTITLLVLLAVGLFVSCNADTVDKVFNESKEADPVVKITYKVGDELITQIIKVPSRKVSKSFLEDNGFSPSDIYGLEFEGIHEIEGNNDGESSFAKCENLETLSMDKSLTKIGSFAFSGCKSLSQVSFPEKIEEIGEKAFYDCENLKNIMFTGKTAPKRIAPDAFNNATVARISVPVGSMNAYENAFDDVVLKGVIIETDYHIVRFVTNGGSNVVNQKIPDGGKAVKPNATKYGYTLKAWYADEEKTSVYDFNTSVTCDTAVYADWSPVPFCFVADNDGVSVKLKEVNGVSSTIELEYSTDGENFSDYTIGEAITAENTGDKIYFRAKDTNPAFSSNTLTLPQHEFEIEGGTMKCEGNIMFLLDKTGAQTSVPERAFSELFGSIWGGCEITSAPDLPATTLGVACYNAMFINCESLVEAPELPAEILVASCYGRMYAGCTNLKTVPALNATQLADNCYNAMFSGCTSLTTAPALPATELTEGCYGSMFYGCSSLIAAPGLPSESLKPGCYANMFQFCTNLKKMPVLSASILAESCYNSMFYGCSNLTELSKLPAKTLAYDCYAHMFTQCTSIETAPVLSATELAESCYASMFEECSNITTAPDLPARTLEIGCYNSMFRNCTKLTDVPDLPALTLKYNCYNAMFAGCESLVNGPVISATEFLNPGQQSGDMFFGEMFKGDSKLSNFTVCFSSIPKNNWGDVRVDRWLEDAGADVISAGGHPVLTCPTSLIEFFKENNVYFDEPENPDIVYSGGPNSMIGSGWKIVPLT